MLDYELEALLIQPGNPLVSFCLLVFQDFSHHHYEKKKKKRIKEELKSPNFCSPYSTTILPSLLPAPFLFPLDTTLPRVTFYLPNQMRSFTSTTAQLKYQLLQEVFLD